MCLFVLYYILTDGYSQVEIKSNHDNFKSIPQELSDVFPPLHRLTGCDNASKVSTKYTVIKTRDLLEIITTSLLNLEKVTSVIE